MSFRRLPAFARDAKKYGVNDLMIWDYTASVYYRPDRGDFWEMPPKRLRELKEALAAVRRMGCSVSSFVNWRLASSYNKSWKYLKPLVQESLFGQGMYGFPCGTMDGGWYNDCGYEQGSYSVCCGADKFRPFATEACGQDARPRIRRHRDGPGRGVELLPVEAARPRFAVGGVGADVRVVRRGDAAHARAEPHGVHARAKSPTSTTASTSTCGGYGATAATAA